MCIIIENSKGVVIDKKVLEDSVKYNPDGIGILFYETGKVFRFKPEKKIVDNLYQYLKGKKYIAHFRYTSRGGSSLVNIHPFMFKNRYYLFHNGTIEGIVHEKGDTRSDTKIFAKLLGELAGSGIDVMSAEMKALIEMMDSKNRFVIYDKVTKNISIINGHLGKNYDGVWYSRDPYMMGRRKSHSAFNYNNVYGEETNATAGTCASPAIKEESPKTKDQKKVHEVKKQDPKVKAPAPKKAKPFGYLIKNGKKTPIMLPGY